jgi:monoamine oxidase
MVGDCCAVAGIANPTATRKQSSVISHSSVLSSKFIAARHQTDHDPNYAVLSDPDGPFYFAGEHLSHVAARQGRVRLSARRSVNMIDKLRRAQHA